MGGKVPAEEMTEERVQLLARGKEGFTNANFSKAGLVAIIESLYYAAQECPRVGCATCSFMAKHERGTLPTPD